MVNDLPRGPGMLLRILGLIILADVVSQYLVAIRPFDTGSPGWRLTAVQVGATQLLPVGMALFLLGTAAYLSPNGSLRRIRLASGGLAIFSLLMLWYFLSSGSAFALRADPNYFGSIRIGLLQSVVRSAAGVLEFGIAWLLLGRLVAAGNQPGSPVSA